MKPLTFLTAFFLLLGITSTTSCEKDSDEEPPANHPPIARAGDDVELTLSSCLGNTGFADLDGSASSDPDGNLQHFAWKKVDGPPGGTLVDPSAAKTSVENLQRGVYFYEVTVSDAEGLSARDVLRINVHGKATSYDLDLTINGQIQFTDNFNSYWDNYTIYPIPYDIVEITGKGVVVPLGELTLSIWEYSDSASLNSVVYDIDVQIQNEDNSRVYLSGKIGNANFKKLMVQGGGGFDGVLQVENSSGSACDISVLTNLVPLAVKGSLNATARTISMQIKGRVYF